MDMMAYLKEIGVDEDDLKPAPSIRDLVKDLKLRKVSGKLLAPKMLLEVVFFLKLHGHSTATIADVLGYSHRQVRRYVERIWEENPYKFTKEFWQTHIARFNHKMEALIDRLTRIAEDPQSSVKERIIANFYEGKNLMAWTRMLSDLGCLPPVDTHLEHKHYTEPEMTSGKIREQEEAVAAEKLAEWINQSRQRSREIIRREEEKLRKEYPDFEKPKEPPLEN